MEKKKEKKDEKSDEEKPVILSSQPSLKQAGLSWNKAGKAKLHRVWSKKSFAKNEKKKRNIRKY